MSGRTLRCGADWKDKRFRCGRPSCERCRRRQILRETRAVIRRLDAPACRFVSVTIRLGVVEDIREATLQFRSDIRNRLNLCRQASKRWAGAAIWGWFAVTESGSGGGFEISAYAIIRIGARLGIADAHDALVRTWSHPGQVEIGAAVDRDGLPILARSVIESAFANGGEFPGVRDFRGLRFRYGRTGASKVRRGPAYYEPMPMLF